jgi:hypothetical protein
VEVFLLREEGLLEEDGEGMQVGEVQRVEVGAGDAQVLEVGLERTREGVEGGELRGEVRKLSGLSGIEVVKVFKTVL